MRQGLKAVDTPGNYTLPMGWSDAAFGVSRGHEVVIGHHTPRVACVLVTDSR
jgi:hypothetical protein